MTQDLKALLRSYQGRSLSDLNAMRAWAAGLSADLDYVYAERVDAERRGGTPWWLREEGDK